MVKLTGPIILCKCGCEAEISTPKFPSRQTYYINGHQGKNTQFKKGRVHPPELIEKARVARIGLKRSEETKERIRLAKLGDKNPRWTGDEIGYTGIHTWLWRYFTKPELCERCYIEPLLGPV